MSGQGAAQPSSGPQSPNAPDNPGNFVGIKQYLDANKNQAAKLGDQVGGVVTQSADEARGNINLLNQEADQKIQGVSSLGDDLKNKIGSAAETLTQQEREQAKNTSQATYKGPTDVTGLGESYTKASSSVNAANQKIGDTATEEGRMNLVKQVNTKPRTQGVDVFDNALLQAGGGREKLATIAEQNKGIGDQFNNTTANIQSRIGRADDPNTPDIDESAGVIGQTNKAQSDAYKTIQDSLNNWTSAFTPKVSQAQQQLVDQQNRISQDIGDNPLGLNQETMDLLGLSDGQRTFGTDLNQYLQMASPSDISAGNFANQEDYARYGALADLAGVTDPLLRQENISQAGTAKTAIGADRDRLSKDVQERQAAFDKAYSAPTQLNPNELASNAPGALPVGTMLNSMGAAGALNSSPKELEEKWLPIIKAAEARSEIARASGVSSMIQRIIDGVKGNNNFNTVVKKNT